VNAFAPDSRPGWLLSLRLALRDLRGGVKGFRVFIACLALGVAAIGGVNSLSRGLQEGLSREGGRILGGDVAFSLQHRPAPPEQMAFLEARGRVSTAATLRVMARAPDGNATLAELKAVDSLYPLSGTVLTEPALPLAQALAPDGGAFGAVADPALMARLGLTIGDHLRVGTADLVVRASLVEEPDVLSSGFRFGPRLLVSRAALDATGLIQPGSLVRWSHRVALPPGQASLADAHALAEAAQAAFPDAGWQVRTRDHASDRLASNVERFTQFLAIVGLTALAVGGVGVANAVNFYVARKRPVIATLKCLGATGGRVFTIHLLQVLALAAVGIALGLVVAAAIPFATSALFAAILPLPLHPALYPSALGLAALYGVLVALVFALWPLGRAHDVPVSALYRDHLDPDTRRPRLRYALAAFAVVAGLIALAIFTAYDRKIALVFLGAIAASFVLLRLVALGIMALAARLPRPRGVELRLALANMHRPGALTPSVVLSLGLGLALLVTLTLIDSSVRRQLTSALPANAPSFFFVDIPRAEGNAFAAFLKAQAPGAQIERVPMLRGRITELHGVPAEKIDPGEAAWVLRGDRGITQSATIPEGSRVVAGTWWAPDHTGDNLVSFEADLARELGLKVGDTIRVNVLGRDVEARVAALRKVDWESLGINFVMVFSPNTFAGAPYQYIATLKYPDEATPQQELGLLRTVAQAFPDVVVVRVKDALATIQDLLGNLALGIRAASGITLLASILVLAGALAAGHRHRLYDAVMLKTLGATRQRVMSAFALEYFLIGAATALFGLAAGTIAAWVVAEQVMDIGFAWDSAAALGAALGALVLTVGLGLAGTWRLLGARPAAVLREL